MPVLDALGRKVDEGEKDAERRQRVHIEGKVMALSRVMTTQKKKIISLPGEMIQFD